jgi:hypothetical protein
MSAGMKVVVLLAAMPIIGVAQEQPKLKCTDFVYSQQFLKAYPKAPAACREVVEKNGQKWVRFDANVTKVNGNDVTADFLNDMKGTVLTLTFTAPPDATLDVSGQQMKYSALKEGQEISIWAPSTRIGFYAAPGSLNSGQLKVIAGKAN